MSESRNFRLHNARGGAALTVRVTPRAASNEVVAVQSDGMIKIRIVAQGADPECDRMLLDYLAEILEVPVKQLEIVAGTGCNDKLITILDIDPDTVQEKLLAQIR